MEKYKNFHYKLCLNILKILFMKKIWLIIYLLGKCNLINIQKNLYFLDNNFNFYYDILNMYLNYSLISYQNIIRLNKFINIIKNKKKIK